MKGACPAGERVPAFEVTQTKRYRKAPPRKLRLMKSVLSAVRSMADKSPLNETAGSCRRRGLALWGLEAATGPHVEGQPPQLGCRAVGARGESARPGEDAGAIDRTEPDGCGAGREPIRTGHGEGVGAAADHEEFSTGGAARSPGGHDPRGQRWMRTIVPV